MTNSHKTFVYISQAFIHTDTVGACADRVSDEKSQRKLIFPPRRTKRRYRLQGNMTKIRFSTSISHGHSKYEQETLHKLLNGTIFNNFERPQPPISRSRHYLMLNILETARDSQ